MAKMIKNKYPDGRVDILNKDSGIILLPNNRIYYVYYGADDMDYCYDLLSHVGEIWKSEVEEIMEEYNIKIKIFEDDGLNYYNVWESFDGENESWKEL